MTRRSAGAVASAVTLLPLVGTTAAVERQLEGRVPGSAGAADGVQAAFELESYAPGESARLVVQDRSRRLTLRIIRLEPVDSRPSDHPSVGGVAVTGPRAIMGTPGKRQLSVRIGRWPSGLYFARLEAGDGRVGFAPLVVAPRRLGASRVAVVLPTLTWQAYNFRDDDHDGFRDSWYVDKQPSFVRLGRAHLDRGIPFGFPSQAAVLNWLSWTNRRVDMLSQLDLESAPSAKALARAYDLIVFPGHHEYVTEKEYDLVENYRDLGGNLLFLSANNFFWRVDRKRTNGEDDVIVKAGRWRDLGRPEAALVGVQYIANAPSPRAAWVVRGARARAWVFAGTGLRAGSSFARGGVEIDHGTRASPPRLQVVAEIPDLFGPGRTAQMTYYETGRGAKVFAAGAFHLANGIASDPAVWRLLENVWKRLARP